MYKMEDNKDIIDDNLKKLGINNMDQLKAFMESIKDVDQELIISQLEKMGFLREHIEPFLKIFKK